MNKLLSLKSLRLLPLMAVALLLTRFAAFATPPGNTSLGVGALSGNTRGSFNTGLGYHALGSNSTGNDNTATGDHALYSNTDGTDNTATGGSALQNSTTGTRNTATGNGALFSNTTGSNNTANGFEALFFNTTGGSNTAAGYFALSGNTTGSANIALGTSAGQNLTTGNSNIDIGNSGVADESNTIRIGDSNQTRTFITGISGTAVIGAGVVVDINGQLGVAPSSRRFKEDIKPMDQASEALFALEPVTFRYKRSIDSRHRAQFGLVAEDVEKVNSDLVARDADGKPYTVRYEAVNAMLLNEFIKARRQIDSQQKQIEALTAGLQRVSAQLELSKAAPQTVAKNQ